MVTRSLHPSEAYFWDIPLLEKVDFLLLKIGSLTGGGVKFIFESDTSTTSDLVEPSSRQDQPGSPPLCLGLNFGLTQIFTLPPPRIVWGVIRDFSQ